MEIYRPKATPCSSCPKPVLWEENVEVWEIFMLWHSQARTAGLGALIGFDINALPVLFVSFGIPQSLWRCYIQRLLVISEAAVSCAAEAAKAAKPS